MVKHRKSQIIECPQCGYAISSIQRHVAKYDHTCPRCHMKRLSSFTERKERPNVSPSR